MFLAAFLFVKNSSLTGNDRKDHRLKDGTIKYVTLRLSGYGDKGPAFELVQHLNPAKKYDIAPDA